MILRFYIICILSFCDYKWYNTIIPHSDAFCNVSNEKNMMNYERYMIICRVQQRIRNHAGDQRGQKSYDGGLLHHRSRRIAAASMERTRFVSRRESG